MLSLLNIRTVARFEIKTLLRSWFFRIFSLLTLFILGFFNLMVVTDVGPNPPWIFRAIAASIPYFNLQIFNLVQAVIIVFLASDFLKRDKKLDTTDVIYIRSMSNGDYVLGKTIGVLVVFFLLNIAVLLMALIFNFVQTDTPVVWAAYFYYPMIITLPTLFYIIGLSFFMMVILRNQAITFIILLGYIASTLFFLTNKYNFIFDYMAFKLPLMYSDFIGFGNLKELLIQRGIYFFSGVSFIFLTILLIKRLPQSRAMTKLSFVFTTGLLVFSGYLVLNYTSNYNSISATKTKMIKINNNLRDENIVHIDEYKIDLEHIGATINATAVMNYSVKSAESVGRLIFSLNPSLEISEFSLDGKSMDFKRDLHTMAVTPSSPIAPGSSGAIVIKYHGTPDDQLSYLDVEEERLDANYTLAFMNVDKRYGFVNENFVLLTPEILWYPIAGTTYSPENPTFQNRQFSTYTLNVKTNEGLEVVAQGTKNENSDGSFTFTESLPLPQIALTIGEYIKKSVRLDSVNLNLYYLEGHDYYAPYISELGDTISSIVSEVKADYELDLNLDYYYKHLSVVEVPIQYYSYARRWASYEEVVQPQMVFMPEKCASLTSADFKSMYNRSKQQTDRNNEGLSEKELQARILNRFISGTFTNGISAGRFRNMNSGNREDFARAVTQTSIYSVFPNYYSYIYHVKSGEWAVLNQTFESYITSDNSDVANNIRRRIGGLSGDENANQALLHKSFEEILQSETDRDLMNEVIKAKGNYLFAYIQNRIGIEEFENFLSRILRAHKFKGLDIEVFNQELKNEFGFDLGPHLETWLKEKNIPGFMLSDILANEIRVGENSRYQVIFKITNQEDVEGLATVSFRLGSSFGGFGRGGGGGPPSMDLERIVHLEPNQQKEIGIVLDSEPRMMAINTMVSQNIPSSLSHFFSKIELNEKMTPFIGERVVEIRPSKNEDFEIIVDNEDKEFELVEPKNESPLKKWLNIEDQVAEQKYSGIRFNRPPRSWRATTQTAFYGKYVLSAYVTAKGGGERQAIWNANIKESGMHEIYYYVGNIQTRGPGRGGGGRRPEGGSPGGPGGDNQEQDRGSYRLTVFHDDGEDVVNMDINSAEEGWNLVGSFYLSKGTTKVVLSNETEGNMVIADAVKWAKVN